MDLAGDPLALFLLGINQATAQTGQGLLRLLAVSDVHRHAQHPLGIAVVCVVEFAPSSEPTYGSVRSKHTKFGGERFPVSFGVSDRLPDEFSVFLVHLATKVLDVPVIAVGRN